MSKQPHRINPIGRHTDTHHGLKAMNKCEIKFSNWTDKMQSYLVVRIKHHWLMLSASVLSSTLCRKMWFHHARKPCRALMEKPLILELAWVANFVKAHMLQKQFIQNCHRESEIRCTICSKVYLALWLSSTCLYRKPKSSESKPLCLSMRLPENAKAGSYSTECTISSKYHPGKRTEQALLTANLTLINSDTA